MSGFLSSERLRKPKASLLGGRVDLSRLASLGLLCAAILTVPVGLRAQQGSASTQQGSAVAQQSPGADSTKAAAIHRLIELIGGTAMVNQVMDGMLQNVQSQLSQMLPEGAYRQQLIDAYLERLRAKLDSQHMLDIATQAYDKYFSTEDIQGMIQFYSTPLGKKTASVLPQLTIEVQTQSVQWGQEMGKQAMIEVLNEHPDLAKALQAAAKK